MLNLCLAKNFLKRKAFYFTSMSFLRFLNGLIYLDVCLSTLNGITAYLLCQYLDDIGRCHQDIDFSHSLFISANVLFIDRKWWCWSQSWQYPRGSSYSGRMACPRAKMQNPQLNSSIFVTTGPHRHDGDKQGQIQSPHLCHIHN